eukprot:CAMPEP_0178939074 /NCGR_PEP_ID=MMETSP0786-20121207/26682_1 /TAXON_ID=186022 /ORGANISM="Thalassionema frauenfeldii, Strain CCMP 1798" /LENGTH=494 /DNA_ID=CAMNT_0020617859 /DNA_START=60 /DNA_END=1544 /DNA_ORIENTATION=+
MNESSANLDEFSSHLRPLHEMSEASDDSSRPKLTLSAFRRDEEIIRVADPDRIRKLTDSYKLSSGIGHGARSTVRLAIRRSDNQKVAVKSVSKHDVMRSGRFGRRGRHLDEWEVLRILKENANVIDLIDVFETNDMVHMVLEYCSGGELFDVIEKKVETNAPYSQNESEAANIIEQVLAVLYDLHGRGIVHRDVKPENLLLMRNEGTHIKLCDFGVARSLLNDGETETSVYGGNDGDLSPFPPGRGRLARAYSNVGSDLYAAPEVCLRDGYGTAVDVYSLGVTLYILLCGFPPVFDLQADGDAGVSFPDAIWSPISEDAKNLIRCMLEVDPEQRITAEKALNSSWIKQNAGNYKFTKTECRIKAKRRLSHLFLPSMNSKIPQVDLELVKSKLRATIEKSDMNASVPPINARKRRRMPNDDQTEGVSPADVDMQGIYRGVASAARSASEAAKGVLCSESKLEVKILDDSREGVDSDVLQPYLHEKEFCFQNHVQC